MRLRNLGLAGGVIQSQIIAEGGAEDRVKQLKAGTLKPNRAMRRAGGVRNRVSPLYSAQADSGVTWPIRQDARPRGGTGTPAHIEQWRAEAQVKRHLQKLTLTALIPTVKDAPTAKAFRLLEPHFKSVWDLARSDRGNLEALEGVGRVTLSRVHSYLETFRVEMDWQA